MPRFDRRMLLVRGLQLPVALLLGRAAVGACVNPDELSDSVQSMRDSLEYKDTAPDAKQACSGCAFFKAEKKAGGACGHCEVMRGPVSATGHCVSWTKRS
jgi:high potential iron-sulfur protein